MGEEILEEALLFVSTHVPIGTSMAELLNGGHETFNPTAGKISQCLADYAKLLTMISPKRLTASRPMIVAGQLAHMYVQKSGDFLPGSEVFLLLKALHKVQEDLGQKLEPYASMTLLLEKRIMS